MTYSVKKITGWANLESGGRTFYTSAHWCVVNERGEVNSTNTTKKWAEIYAAIISK